MSTMPATAGHSEACCNIPPIVVEGYQGKGSYEQVGGYKTYVTGPADASRAIIFIFDIFGFFPQTLQGADILANADDHHKYKVFMPDWFKGNPAPIEIFPPDTEDKQKKLSEFLGSYPPSKMAGLVADFIKVVKEQNPSISKIAGLGFCWGGKVITLTAKSSDKPLSVAASAHPAMVDKADAEGLDVPTILLASGDEPKDEVKAFEDALKVPKHVEIFGDQVHGWMAARSDLKNDRVKQEYERGYKTLLTFFGKHM